MLITFKFLRYLEKIEMSPYYNIIISKGIKNLDDLLKCDKKVRKNLVINQTLICLILNKF
jgi:hypothetical protein